MSEKEKTLVDQIEKLLLDGESRVVGKLEAKMEEVKNDLRQELGEKIHAAKNELRQELGGKIDRLGKTLDVTARASYELLTDVRGDVKEVKTKLEEHVRLPVHA